MTEAGVSSAYAGDSRIGKGDEFYVGRPEWHKEAACSGSGVDPSPCRNENKENADFTRRILALEELCRGCTVVRKCIDQAVGTSSAYTYLVDTATGGHDSVILQVTTDIPTSYGDCGMMRAVGHNPEDYGFVVTGVACPRGTRVNLVKVHHASEQANI